MDKLSKQDCNRIIVFINPHFTLGGVDTYFFRMIRWMSVRKIRSILLLTKNAKVDEQLIKQVKEMGTEVRMEIEPYPVTGEMSPTKIDLHLPDGSDVIAMTTRHAGFYVANRLRIDNPKVKFTFMDYMTHVNGYKADVENKTKEEIGGLRYFYRQKRYQHYKKITRKMFESQEIFFQNDIHRYSLYDYYGWNHEDTVGANIPLGIDIPELDEEAIVRRSKRETFMLLTVSRFEFPFKAYLLGLVKQFEVLCERYDNLELVIIGGGPDEERLRAAIRELKSEVQKKISMPGYVDYDKLHDYFEKTSLYVGQGTTVLDAGKQGVLAVPVAFYTEECRSYSYLYQYVEIYAPEAKYDTSKFIKEVIQMSDEEYIDICKKTYENVKKELDLENVMPHILKVQNAPNRYELSRLELWMIKKLNMMILNR